MKADCEYRCIRKPNGEHHDACPANPSPPEPTDAEAQLQMLKDELHDTRLAAEQYLVANLAGDPKAAYYGFQLQSVFAFFDKRRKPKLMGLK